MRTSLIIAAIAVSFSTLAQAAPFQDYGTVLSVTPKSATRMEETCGPAEEVVTSTTTQPGPNDGTAGAIVGGVVGGVLGHQVGGGRGKDVATVIGAIGGTLLGQNMGNQPSTSVQRQNVIRCVRKEVNVVSEYEVVYSYQGRKFVTTMKQPPDRRILLNVDISPVAY